MHEMKKKLTPNKDLSCYLTSRRQKLTNKWIGVGYGKKNYKKAFGSDRNSEMWLWNWGQAVDKLAEKQGKKALNQQ